MLFPSGQNCVWILQFFFWLKFFSNFNRIWCWISYMYVSFCVQLQFSSWPPVWLTKERDLAYFQSVEKYHGITMSSDFVFFAQDDNQQLLQRNHVLNSLPKRMFELNMKTVILAKKILKRMFFKVCAPHGKIL